MATIAGERRIVTVLFADVVGSTAIGEKLGAERTKLLLDEALRIMSAEVERFDGTVAQFIGDELYALFGAPVAHEDDSERAVRAGLAIQSALSSYAQEVREAYGVELAARIAINTGPVVIRPDSDDPYNALGDTVNVAARIQKLVSGGEIIVGDETKLQIENAFELECLGGSRLEGLSRTVTTYRVLGPVEATSLRPAGVLVGRDYELSVLERAMDHLAEGRGAIFAIHGEPGVGKSRLLAEVRSKYQPRIHFLEGRAVSYAQHAPYWPIRELLRDWLGLDDSPPEARVRLELKTALGRLFGDDAENAYPFIATLLGIALDPDARARLAELNRESIQRQTFEFFTELVCRLAHSESVCLVFEDLHFADEASLELIEALLPATDEAAVGICLLFRSEREHGSWLLGEHARQRFPHRYRELELRPLPEDASRTLACELAAGELPDSVASLLASRAGGNPFFLEEALRDLMERGLLRRDNGRLALTVSPDELAVPTILQAALQARIDRLDPETRDVLGYAAVIGREFSLPLLERLLPREQVLRALSQLQRFDLVVEQRRRPDPEYRFRHGLVQEAAYASQLETKRRRLHARVGEALEELAGDNPDLGPLARHFAEGDVPDKAAEYLLRAGDAARALYADQEALDYYRRARDFLVRLDDDRRARDTLFKMALAHHLSFDFQHAEEAYDEAFCCRVEELPSAEPTETLETAIRMPDGITPGYVYTTEGTAFVDQLFRGLVCITADLNVVPEMADNFRVSADGLTYLFRLHEDARWSDGKPLTADDFAYAWEQMRVQDVPTAFLLDDVESAEALDDRTLEVRLVEPRSFFPYLLASTWFYPWPRHRCLELGDAWREPENLVGNGPYVLREFSAEGAVLVPNPYWRGTRGNVGEVRFQFGWTKAAFEEAWREGRFDMLSALDPSLQNSPNTLATRRSGLGLNYLAFRADREPFSSELVRKAFAHAIDRVELAEALGEMGRVATRGGVIPPAMPGHSHRIALEHDLALARELLEQAGYPDGQGLPELTVGVPGWLSGSSVLVRQWQRLGARIALRTIPDRCPEPDLGSDIWVTGWNADFPDPDGLFRGLLQRPHAFYCDEEIEELLQRARSVQDQGERMRLYHEVDRLWVREHAAIVPLAYKSEISLRRPWVEGAWETSLGRTQLDRLWVRRGTKSDGLAAVSVPDQA